MAEPRNKTLRGLAPMETGRPGSDASQQSGEQAPTRHDTDQLLTRGYQLLDRLGSGGMGEVWRARSLRLDRLVAIKRVASEIPGSNELLVREARAIARLRHPSIVQVYDVVYDDDGAPYLVMELLHGADLGEVLDDKGPLDELRAVQLMLGIISGLELAHRNGIVHGDVKPDNVFLTVDGAGKEKAILLDFGIAHAVAPNPSETLMLAGTPEFMAPEQVSGTVAGPAADQWSVCVTLYTLITGRQPFSRDDTVALFDAIRSAALPYPRDVSMDPPLFAILARGTRKQPAERYADVTELRTTLETWHRGKSARPKPPIDPWRKP